MLVISHIRAAISRGDLPYQNYIFVFPDVTTKVDRRGTFQFEPAEPLWDNMNALMDILNAGG